MTWERSGEWETLPPQAEAPAEAPAELAALQGEQALGEAL